jgi:hypothetical protein
MENAIVYVHLGESKPATLLHFVEEMRRNYAYSNLFLISDFPENWSDFPGTVLHLDREFQSFFPLAWRVLHHDWMSVASGYWKNTLLRLFCLEQLSRCDLISEDCLIVHVESDVLVMSCPTILTQLRKSIRKTSVVRLADDLAIAAIVLIPGKAELQNFTKGLRNLLFRDFRWKIDMKLLALAIDEGICDDLNSYEILMPVTLGRNQILLDGWPAGQYLFGQDPIHTNGEISGGYLSPYSRFDFTQGHWRMDIVDGCCPHNHLLFRNEERDHVVASLHVHSKLLVNAPNSSDKLWIQTIEAANEGRGFPVFRGNPSSEIHTSNGPFSARVIRRVKSLFSHV